MLSITPFPISPPPLLFLSGRFSKGHTLTHYPNYTHSPITGAREVSHSAVCSLTDEHVTKFTTEEG